MSLRPDFLGVRLTPDERATLTRIAQRKKSTLSDVVRSLIAQAAQSNERAAAVSQTDRHVAQAT